MHTVEVDKNKPAIAERLLNRRSLAGADEKKHAHYHRLVNRYQRLLLKNHLFRYRASLVTHWRQVLGGIRLKRFFPWLT